VTTREDLMDLRLKAAFRERPELLTAWGITIVNAGRVQQELLQMGWSECDQVHAAHMLCKTVMDCAPWGERWEEV